MDSCHYGPACIGNAGAPRLLAAPAACPDSCGATSAHVPSLMCFHALQQALPPEGPTFAVRVGGAGGGGGGGGLDSGDLYTVSDSDSSPRPAPRRLADTLKSNSGFDSDESGGMRMVPLGKHGDAEGDSCNAEDVFGSGAGAARGLSPANSDAGCSSDGELHGGRGRQGADLPLQRPWAVGGRRAPRASAGSGDGGSDGAIEMGRGGDFSQSPFRQQGAAAAAWAAPPGTAADEGGLDFDSADEMSPQAMRANLRPLEGVMT